MTYDCWHCAMPIRYDEESERWLAVPPMVHPERCWGRDVTYHEPIKREEEDDASGR